jgi:hypothetical protein
LSGPANSIPQLLDDTAPLGVAPQVKAILPDFTQKTTAQRCCIRLPAWNSLSSRAVFIIPAAAIGEESAAHNL